MAGNPDTIENCRMGGDQQQRDKRKGWFDALGSLEGPIRAIKLGPSIVAVLATLGAFGLVAIGAVIFVLAANPPYAIAAGALIAIFILVLIQVLLKFTANNQIVAALGGGQIVQVIQAQLGAKNPEIIIEHQASSSGGPISETQVDEP